jgi:hypothetical protein
MSEQEIIEGNKLIAEFMGVDFYDKYFNINLHDSLYTRDNYNLFINMIMELHPNDLKYNSSWDWLIPVIDKIEDLDVSDQHYQWEMEGETRSNFMCFEFDMDRHSDSYSASIWMELSLDPVCLVAGGHLKPYSTRIEAVWNTVIEFIKYYNETYEKVV